MGIGSLFTGKMMSFSRRTAFIALNVAAIAACFISVLENYWCIIVGRFLYGFTAALFFGILPKMLQENLPHDHYERGYGALPNVAVESFKQLYVLASSEYGNIIKLEKDMGMKLESNDT